MLHKLLQLLLASRLFNAPLGAVALLLAPQSFAGTPGETASSPAATESISIPRTNAAGLLLSPPALRPPAAPAVGGGGNFSSAPTPAAQPRKLAPAPAATLPAPVNRSLGEVEMRELLVATLQSQVVKSRGELELRLTRPWTAITVPDAPLTVKLVDLPSTGVSANFIARFELWAGEKRLGEWQIVAQAKVWKEVPVARSLLRPKQLLRDADVAVERMDVLRLNDPLDPGALQDSSLELVTTVSAGAPLLARVVRPRPLVQRGGLVDANFQSGTLNISLKVEVLEDGHRGQNIRIRNPKTKREFLGKVENETTITVLL